MPYSPGIQDISGQLLGRGIEAAAQARAQGMGAIGNTISNLFGQYTQKRAQDEEFMAKAKSMENFIKTHADDFAPVDPQTGQKNPEAVLQFLSQSPDENAKQKYMRLGSFLDTAVTGTKMQQAQAATRFEQMRADQAKAELDETKRAMAEYASVFGPQKDASGANIPAPNIPSYLMAKAPASAATFAQDLAKQMPSYAGGAEMEGQPVAEAASQAVPQTAGGMMRDPYVKQAVAATGLIPTTKNMGRILQEAGQLRKAAETQAKNERAAGVLYSDEEEAQKDADVFNADPKNVGVVALVQPDATRGGFAIKKQTTSLRTPQQEGATAAAIEEAKLTTQRAGELNTKIAQEALDAVQDRPRLQRIRELYKAGTESGFGKDFVVTFKGVLTSLGFGDPKKLEDPQELQALLEKDAFAQSQKYLKGSGSISNQERASMAKISQSFNKVPGANLALINMTEAAYNKAEAAESYRANLEAQPNMDERKIAAAMRVWIRDPKNSLDRFAPRDSGIPPKGTRVIQNGVKYESDGFMMKEID